MALATIVTSHDLPPRSVGLCRPTEGPRDMALTQVSTSDSCQVVELSRGLASSWGRVGLAFSADLTSQVLPNWVRTV